MKQPNEYFLFRKVASVIGEEKATEEIQKVIDTGIMYEEDGEMDSLSEMFDWDKSPQRHSFWSDIDDGINPYSK